MKQLRSLALLLTIIAACALHAQEQGVSSYAPPNIITPENAAQLPDKYNPLITVMIMVKNEEPVIIDTLQPFLDAGITSYFVYDTGSTDRTVEVTQKWFEDNNLTETSHIIEEPFINFRDSRNKALDHADRLFPDAGYFLFLDAEWYFHGADQLVEFCKIDQHRIYPPEWEPHSYLVRIVNPSIDFYTQRLIRRGAPQARFIGVVHETIGTGTPYRIPREIYFELGVSRYGMDKSASRWERDERLLREEHEKNPNDSRTTFYLAQTLECLGRNEEAYDMYLLRTTQEGWSEEDFMTWYRLGQLTERMITQYGDDHPRYNWRQAVEFYLEAYQLRPQRVEPLIKLSVSYLGMKKHNLAYLFGLRAVQTPYPAKDVLFVDKFLYDYTRWDAMSQCSWYVGDFTTGKTATEQALRAQPGLAHLHRNLSFYLEKEQQIKMQRQQYATMLEAQQEAARYKAEYEAAQAACTDTTECLTPVYN